MGIKGLFSFIRTTGVRIGLNEIKNKKIGIDISYYIYKYGATDASPYIQLVRTLEANNNKVLLVFDGKPSDRKAKEVETRKAAAVKASQSASALEESLQTGEFSDQQKQIIQKAIRNETRKAARPTKDQRRFIKMKLYEEKVFMLKSLEEADELLAALAVAGDIDLIISADTDLLRLGAECVCVPTDDDNVFIELRYSKVLKHLGLSADQFQLLCVLTGSVPQIEVRRQLDIRKAWSWIRCGQIEKFCGEVSEIQKKLAELPSVDVVERWIREDEVDRLEAWRCGNAVPYTY